MSNKYHTALVFRDKAASRRFAAAYRKQFDLGVDGKPRQRGKKTKQAKKT